MVDDAAAATSATMVRSCAIGTAMFAAVGAGGSALFSAAGAGGTALIAAPQPTALPTSHAAHLPTPTGRAALLCSRYVW